MHRIQLIFLKAKFVYILFEREDASESIKETENEKERERWRFSIHCFQMPSTAGSGQAEAKSWNLARPPSNVPKVQLPIPRSAPLRTQINEMTEKPTQ